MGQVDGGMALLPDSKTGPRVIWIGSAARRLFADVPRTASPLVFPGEDGGSIESALIWRWRRVREEAALPGLRIHDLRHGFASVAVGGGETLRTLAGLLGHSDLTTTDGYAHLATEPVAKAAERVAAHLTAALAEPKAPAPARKRERRKARAKPGRAVAALPEDLLSLQEDILRFLKSSSSLLAFCRERGLEEGRFRNALLAWRAQRAGGRAAR